VLISSSVYSCFIYQDDRFIVIFVSITYATSNWVRMVPFARCLKHLKIILMISEVISLVVCPSIWSIFGFRISRLSSALGMSQHIFRAKFSNVFLYLVLNLSHKIDHPMG
jgi:hypothetical protein